VASRGCLDACCDTSAETAATPPSEADAATQAPFGFLTINRRRQSLVAAPAASPGGVGGVVQRVAATAAPAVPSSHWAERSSTSSNSGGSPDATIIAAGLHTHAVRDTVTVEGRDGERAVRTTDFRAVVEQLLPNGGYFVRDVLSPSKHWKHWTKIDDASRVKAYVQHMHVNLMGTMFAAPSKRDSIENRSVKNQQLAAAEAEAAAQRRVADENMRELEKETVRRKAAEMKAKTSAKAAVAANKVAMAAENTRVADAARANSTVATLVEEAVGVKTAELQAQVEALRRALVKEGAKQEGRLIQQKVQHDAEQARLLRFAMSEVDATKDTAAVEHNADLERQKQVCFDTQ
jgi:hypothetical protein